MTVLAGLFLIAHGLVHGAIWIPKPGPDAPFDSRHSWLLGERPALVRTLAVAACVLFVIAGVLVLSDADLASAMAVAGAVVSLLLVGLTFNPWFLAAIAINVAIIVIALANS
jgi:hypothetical protein